MLNIRYDFVGNRTVDDCQSFCFCGVLFFLPDAIVVFVPTRFNKSSLNNKLVTLIDNNKKYVNDKK
jgi:hypothetical protein